MGSGSVMSQLTESLPSANQMIPQDRPAKRPRRESASGDGSSTVNFDISGAACHYCHARKVKVRARYQLANIIKESSLDSADTTWPPRQCGGELPTCAGCSKANVRCMVYDPNAPQTYTREYVNNIRLS